jgi:hypothetical protein
VLGAKARRVDGTATGRKSSHWLSKPATARLPGTPHQDLRLDADCDSPGSDPTPQPHWQHTPRGSSGEGGPNSLAKANGGLPLRGLTVHHLLLPPIRRSVIRFGLVADTAGCLHRRRWSSGALHLGRHPNTVQPVTSPAGDRVGQWQVLGRRTSTACGTTPTPLTPIH